MGAWAYDPRNPSFPLAFGKLLCELKIKDNDVGLVNFNSFRDRFITRCDEYGIPRHAVRGVVGHVSYDQTDLYSHDLVTARQIQQLPTVKLDK